MSLVRMKRQLLNLLGMIRVIDYLYSAFGFWHLVGRQGLTLSKQGD